MYMSKQFAMEDWAPSSWIFTAKGYYLQMLREAAHIENLDEQLKEKRLCGASNDAAKEGGGLFRFGRAAIAAINCTTPTCTSTSTSITIHDDAPSVANATDTAATMPAAVPFVMHGEEAEDDIVTEEAGRWKRMDKFTIKEVSDADGTVNEMALLFKLRKAFPLHYCVFKQVASHICHEANTEQLFSLAGALSDNNGRMCPDNLSTWTAVGANIGAYKPSVQLIKERYFKLFSKGGIDVDA